MTEKKLTPFCDNAFCTLHSVMVTEATVEISRELPGGLEEKHSRFGYALPRPVVLCEVCHQAVQLCTEAYEEGQTIKEKLEQQLVAHTEVAGLPVIDASAGVGELWVPPEKKIGSA